jgi:ribose/xylose/arabinose/galactoside ABC-type transport system permease subunit
MKRNVGGIDRSIRIIAGLVILSLFFALDENTRWWALIGLVPLLTGLIGWCPAYLPFGLRTCKLRRD